MTGAVAADHARPSGLRRSRRLGAVLIVLAVLASLGFASLAVWQIERRSWKLDLIARVDARLAERPVPAPGRLDWPNVSRDRDEYRRMTLTGRFLDDRSIRTMAVTERGPGFWLLTPMVTEAHDTVLVNRGFVPSDWTADHAAPQSPVTVVGLVRMSEPGGGFLRSNDPAQDRWYSRDVEAIAEARSLGPVAPFFVDADGSDNGPGRPVGGLTVVTFRNNHLVYALTWLALAGMSGWAAVKLFRERMQ